MRILLYSRHRGGTILRIDIAEPVFIGIICKMTLSRIGDIFTESKIGIIDVHLRQQRRRQIDLLVKEEVERLKAENGNLTSDASADSQKKS